MKVTFVRQKAIPLFFAAVPITVNGVLVANLPNGKEFVYEGPAEHIHLKGPGVVRNVEFDLIQDYDEVIIEFKIAMGLMAGGFLVKILRNGEIVQKLRKTF